MISDAVFVRPSLSCASDVQRCAHVRLAWDGAHIEFVHRLGAIGGMINGHTL